MKSVRTDWRNLRIVAEAMHGLQKRKQVGVRVVKGKLKAEKFDKKNSGKYVLHTAKPSSKNRPVVDKKSFKVYLPGLQFTGVPDIPADGDLYEAVDAIFWSLAAVEKFLVPYYSSFWELQNVMDEIYLAFKDQSDVLAFVHLPNSEPSEGTDDGSRVLNGLFAMKPDPRKKDAFYLTSII